MIFYFSMLAISLLLVVIYAFIFHKHFDVNITIMTALVAVVNFGFVVIGMSQNIQEALIGLKISYIGGCYVLVFAMFLIFNVCGVEIKPWLRAVILTISSGVYATSITVGQTDLFYKGLPTLETYGGASMITNRQYGPMHTVFYVMVILFYLATLGVIVYSFFKKKQVPRIILILIVISVSVAIFGFFGGKVAIKNFEILPATYNIGIIINIIMAARLRLYDASDSVTDALVEKGDTGFISFDSRMRYLNSNETAKEMIPELSDLIVDHHIENHEELRNDFEKWVEEYKADNTKDRQYIKRDDKTYLVTISRLEIAHFFHSHRGYQFFITDDTANQQYIELIKNYNNQLEEEVKKKTINIIEMQDKLVLGMATMVEGRDNSTGGHIKRTSDCIRILVDEIKKDNRLNLSDSFCQCLIKAAPMHDLGKITVDDVILRKPGRFTPEEFEIMKTHAAEGARIVDQILDGTDDKEFAKIAVNVAHYHHERWDGSGYPKGLKGEEIPLEARIMAIADVYDALVSKRVYKESMSFEKANQIIMEGMGSQFDKNLESYYVSARPKLEEYYKNIEQ